MSASIRAVSVLVVIVLCIYLLFSLIRPTDQLVGSEEMLTLHEILLNHEKYAGKSVGDGQSMVDGRNSSLQMSSFTLSSSPPSLHLSLDQSSSSLSLTREVCLKRYRAKRYLSEEESENRVPPIFYSFPGAGNTWGRLLLEHATGIWTGSVYNDHHIVDSLHGEFTCDRTVSCVKAHPHTHPFAGAGGLFTGGFKSDQNKCSRNGVRRFQKALLLVRNPFDAIWSEFQRRISKGNHVAGIRKHGFPWAKWRANAAWLAYRYQEMWDSHYAHAQMMLKKEDIVLLKYENLKDKSTRIETLHSMIQFLDLPTTLEKMKCSFMLATDKRAKRTIDFKRDMDKIAAYPRDLACGMWEIFKSSATGMGYGLPRGVAVASGHAATDGSSYLTPSETSNLCRGVPPLRDIELNHKNEPGVHPDGKAIGYGKGTGKRAPPVPNGFKFT
jgi:hypothetical protein